MPKKPPIRMLKFTGEGCVPCRHFAPVVDRFVEKHPELAYQEVDVLTAGGWKLYEQHGVERIPTVLLLRGRKLLARHVGSTTQRVLEALLRRAMRVDDADA